jgi:hypothetical protein
MTGFLITVSCCIASVGAFAQSFSTPYKKLMLTPDTTVSLHQPSSYTTMPAHLDFSITKPAITPFFCRQEIKWEQALKFPLRFRLGSVDQANWLEQKGDRYQPFK